MGKSNRIKNSKPKPKQHKPDITTQQLEQNTGPTSATAFSNLSERARKRLLSSETSDGAEEAEVLIDAVLGALTNDDIIDRFVSALVEIPDIKNRILDHLAPTLKTEIDNQLQPLRDDIKRLNEDLKESKLQVDDLEQYGRRHSLRVSGIPEMDRENTDFLICEFLQQELEIEIDPSEIDRSHRLGKKSKNVNRPIAVKFLNYRLKEHIYANRRYLRPGLYINESLTKGRSNLFYKARQLKKQQLITETWTRDGIIFIKKTDGSIISCTRDHELPISFAPPKMPSTEVPTENMDETEMSVNQQESKIDNKTIPNDSKNHKQNSKTNPTYATVTTAVVHNMPPDDNIEILEVHGNN